MDSAEPGRTNSNHDTIGATVRVGLGDHQQVQEVRGGGYLSPSDFRLGIGIGKVMKVDSIEIRWLNGLLHLENIQETRIVKIREGTGILEQ